MSEISKNQNIPVKYLEQLIIPLKKARLIKSLRGPRGGHMLLKSPDKINLWEVLNLLETEFTLVDCVNEKGLCEYSEHCPVRPIWGRAYKAMMGIFRETSLADICQFHEDHKADG